MGALFTKVTEYSILRNSPNLGQGNLSHHHSLISQARKKFVNENNKPLGRKNIVNAIRELMFAIQIAKTGRINDFTAANDLKKEVCSCTEEDWEFYKTKFKPISNKLSTEFKKLAPKDIKFEIIYKELSNDPLVMEQQRKDSANPKFSAEENGN